MRGLILAAGGVMALVSSAPAMSADSGPSSYLLSLRMTDGGRVVGAPTLALAAGKPARLQWGAAGNRYAISVTATPQTADTIYLASTIDVASGTSHRTADPDLLMIVGKPAGITFGRTDSAGPLHVDFTIATIS